MKNIVFSRKEGAEKINRILEERFRTFVGLAAAAIKMQIDQAVKAGRRNFKLQLLVGLNPYTQTSDYCKLDLEPEQHNQIVHIWQSSRGSGRSFKALEGFVKDWDIFCYDNAEKNIHEIAFKFYTGFIGKTKTGKRFIEELQARFQGLNVKMRFSMHGLVTIYKIVCNCKIPTSYDPYKENGEKKLELLNNILQQKPPLFDWEGDGYSFLSTAGRLGLYKSHDVDGRILGVNVRVFPWASRINLGIVVGNANERFAEELGQKIKTHNLYANPDDLTLSWEKQSNAIQIIVGKTVFYRDDADLKVKLLQILAQAEKAYDSNLIKECMKLSDPAYSQIDELYNSISQMTPEEQENDEMACNFKKMFLTKK